MGADDLHLARGLEFGYARVSTKQSLERQLAALGEAGIRNERIYVDKKTGATVDRGIGRPVTHPEDEIEYARLLKGQGVSLGQIATKTGIPKTSLHRYLGAATTRVER
ncbi:recombinase family protein [Saccharopolyspora sp. K220]|uniref:recombinase family protein n=1 Tax=Saccharopolyspora soli TaxID=2926618 RepID=UPI001F565ACE|nr:recombinase family protein [Saccharopolyspora soli]MCI2420985.1 recombinase family protein [Saccharopolyspora soli]